MRDIVRIGREHLATEGAAALSLRAVARDLGLVSSAVYRYVASRDELLTLLVVDGYDELGDAVDAALEPVDRDDHVGRVVAIARATRAWALAEPATYALLFGSPVPGYEAPAEQTTGPGTRVVGRLVEVWEDAWQAGAISLDEAPLAPRGACRATWPGSASRWASPPPTVSSPAGSSPGRRSSGACRSRCSGSTAPTPSPTPRTSSSTTSQALVAAVGLT